MRIFNRIFVVFFLAVLTLSGGAAEVRRTLLAEDATQGWELPANVRMAGSEFMIPAGSGGEEETEMKKTYFLCYNTAFIVQNNQNN